MEDVFYQLCQGNGKIHISRIPNIHNIKKKQNNNNHAIATLCGTVATCESSVDKSTAIFLTQIDISQVTCYECKKKYQELTQHIKNDTDKYEERV